MNDSPKYPPPERLLDSFKNTLYDGTCLFIGHIEGSDFWYFPDYCVIVQCSAFNPMYTGWMKIDNIESWYRRNTEEGIAKKYHLAFLKYQEIIEDPSIVQ